MKERYRDELPRWLRMLGAWRVNRDSIDFIWGYFAPRFGLEFILHRGTYFDQRYAISFALGWGKFMVYLPVMTDLKEGCDMPMYGFGIHSGTFWLYHGGDYDESIGQCQNKYWAWDLPFVTYEFDGHWIKDKDGNWARMGHYKLGNKEGGPGSWEFRKDGAYSEVHPYKYTLKSGEVQERTATCTIEKRKWHRKWFPFLTLTREVIDIEFNGEVGERTGSWKGGTIGCSYEMLPGESIEACIRRMESERVFD